VESTRYRVSGDVVIYDGENYIRDHFEFTTFNLKWGGFAGLVQQSVSRNPWLQIREGFSATVEVDSVEVDDVLR
jgi:hypothetical protein